ncbi:hypothetical protein ACJRO7_027294 [Eucalyptus globulus]|uniref:Uncharacterized protein n=1 Tax=Eucalyptus globulus TaxID=34317 RepID=A0ABD3JVW9_EUCGL
MEGLIPFVIRSVRKQRLYSSYRCLSDGSARSYHLLAGGESVDGSSHRRTKSELPQLSAAEFKEQRSGVELARAHSMNKGSMVSTATAANGSNIASSYYPQINKDVNTGFSTLRHRR